MSSKVQFQIVTHSPTDTQLSAACQCAQSKLSSLTTFIWKKKKKLNLDGKIAVFFLEIKNLNNSGASVSVIAIRMTAALVGYHVIRRALELPGYCCSAMTLK